VTTVITVLCLAAIAFNIRFFVALCREKEHGENTPNQLSKQRDDDRK